MEKEEQKKNFSKGAKKAAALAIMFSLGVSAFSEVGRGDGRLFGKEANTINANAVEDYLELKDFARIADKDGQWTVDEIETGNFLTNRFEKNYGKGSVSLVTQAEKENLNAGISTYSDSVVYQFEKKTSAKTEREYTEAKKDIAAKAVATAARHQRQQFDYERGR